MPCMKTHYSFSKRAKPQNEREYTCSYPFLISPPSPLHWRKLCVLPCLHRAGSFAVYAPAWSREPDCILPYTEQGASLYTPLHGAGSQEPRYIRPYTKQGTLLYTPLHGAGSLAVFAPSWSREPRCIRHCELKVHRGASLLKKNVLP